MRPALWLGLDVGTTGTRCVAFDEHLQVVAGSYREDPPQVGEGGRVEQDPQSWVSSSLAVLSDTIAQVDPAAVRAMAVSSQGITVVPVDRTGAVLRPAISWLDLRGDEMLACLAQSWDPAEVTARTGKGWNGSYVLPKALWLARHEPVVMQACSQLLLPLDFLMLRLTGRTATDHTMAGGTMYYRNDHRGWDRELLASAGLGGLVLPELVLAGERVGSLLPELAAQVGLPGPIEVRMGGQDQKCAALAAGLAPGVGTLSLGTAGALEILQTTPTGPAGIPLFPFLTAGEWVSEGVVETAGAAHRWITRTLGLDYPALEEAAAASVPGGPLFFPHLGRFGTHGSEWGVEPAGVFWGLGLASGPGELTRAVVEGVACEVELLREAMAPQGLKSLRVFGGGARSRLWCQTLADTTGTAIEVLDTHETAAAGAAMLAGSPGRLRVAETFIPSPTGRAAAAARLASYRRIRDRLYA